ncbi:hypothetical protein DPMN_062005 [Dreissena polymorpha]|uniref:Uncharacterized protein n=1 Tax=Dreissena polymorpha TaxID=45954 RepID=A0A9D4C8Y5_DREPO|nr:hypothetical protein DPMN_062005 [Dreissena polymorpha]
MTGDRTGYRMTGDRTGHKLTDDRTCHKLTGGWTGQRLTVEGNGNNLTGDRTGQRPTGGRSHVVKDGWGKVAASRTFPLRPDLKVGLTRKVFKSMTGLQEPLFL